MTFFIFRSSPEWDEDSFYHKLRKNPNGSGRRLIRAIGEEMLDKNEDCLYIANYRKQDFHETPGAAARVSMVERRKAHRIQEKAEVRIRLADSEDELACKVIHQLTQDLSLVGIRIQCNVFIPVHSLLKIELSLKKPLRFISVLGRVRWVKAIYEDELYEMGVEFVDTPQEALRLLEMHIEEFPN